MRNDFLFLCLFLAIFPLCTGLFSVTALPAEKETAAETNPLATAAQAQTAPENINFAHNVYSIELYQPQKLTLTTSTKNAYAGTLTWGVGNSAVAKVDADGVVTIKKMGQSAVFATTEDGRSAVCIVRANLPTQWLIEDVPILYQWDDFPSGCESVSATMLLQYYGCDISAYEFVDTYLPTGYLTEDEQGNLSGPDTSSVFIGSPYSTESLGCYPPVIAYAANQVLQDGNEAVNTTGSSIDSMIQTYILQNKPVLVWSTMYMWEPFTTYTWTVTDAASYSPYDNGDACSWIANEHCLVLIGYDEKYYYFNDPNFTYSTRYEKDVFKERFAQVGYASMAITGDVQRTAPAGTEGQAP